MSVLLVNDLKGLVALQTSSLTRNVYKDCQSFKQGQGRKLTSVEACLLIDEAAACVVAKYRRSAGMRQFTNAMLRLLMQVEPLHARRRRQLES